MNKQRAAQLVDAAVWLEATGDVDGARKLYQQALELDPENAGARKAVERGQARPAPAGAPPPGQGTLIQYPGAAEALPRVEPDQPDSTTDPSLHRTLPGVPFDAQTTLPGIPFEAFQPGGPEPELKWEGPREGSSPAAVTQPAPEAPRPRARPRPGPAGATPPPRNAWEDDGTPGEDLSANPPPRSGPRDVMDLLSDAPPRATPPPVKPGSLRQEVDGLIKSARDRLELDDHSGAMNLIEKAAELAPEDPVVQRLRERSEVVLTSMFESKLGRLDARPRLLLRPDEIIWLNLDHRAGFVLAQIDGSVTYEDLFAICGMSRLDTLRILSQLVGAGVIAVAGERSP
jgi:hypothetical protein